MSTSLPASAALRSATERLASLGTDAQAFAVLSVDELRTLLTTIATLAASAVGMLGTNSTRECPRMLTVEEFRVRYGGTPKPPTAATVERWCRDGDLPYAMLHGKAGWRIPEFHLWSKEPPPALRWAFAHLMPEATVSDEAPAGASPAAAPVDTTDGEGLTGHSGDAEDATAAAATAANAERAARLTSDGYDPDRLDDYKVILASRRKPGAAATDAAKPEAIPSEARTAGNARKEVRRSSA